MCEYLKGIVLIAISLKLNICDKYRGFGGGGHLR